MKVQLLSLLDVDEICGLLTSGSAIILPQRLHVHSDQGISSQVTLRSGSLYHLKKEEQVYPITIGKQRKNGTVYAQVGKPFVYVFRGAGI